MRNVLFFLITFWTVIYSNARMPDNVPTYKFVHLFPIPQAVRLAELLLLLFLFVLAFTRPMQKRLFISSLCTVAFVVLAVGNLLLMGKLSLSGIQEIYVRMAPYLIFVAVAQGGKASAAELQLFVKFYGVVLALNVLVALLLQIPFYGFHEDNIHGFFEDSHLLCNTLLVFAVVLFYDYLHSRKLLLLLVSVALLLLSVYPSNEKVIVLCVLIMAGMYVRHLFTRTSSFLGRLFLVAGISTVLLGGAYYVQKKGGEELWARADILINSIGIENIGPIHAWPIAVHEIGGSPKTQLLGVGAGEYGWIAAGRNLNEGKGTKHSKQFDLEFEMDSVNNSGFLYRTNTWSSLLAEFGWLGFILFLMPLLLIVRGVRQYPCGSRLEQNLKMAFYITLIIVIFQGFFTPYSNWSTAVLMYPMMYLAAYFHKRPQSSLPPEVGVAPEQRVSTV